MVHVASSASHYPLDELPPDEGVIRVPALNVLENRLGVPYPIFSPKLHTVLARELKRADVVHAHGLLYQSSFWALRYAKLRHRGPSGPVRVLTEHVGHVPYESGVLDRMESMAIGTIGRLSVKAAESVVVLNRQVGSEVEALGPNGPVLQIPNGIDTSLFRPAQNGEREALRREFGWDDLPRVLFVGRLVAKKGLDTALAAAAAALGKFELVVAGPGPLQPESSPGVRVLGPLESERVAQLYRAADALLLPSRGEGFPVTVQEAMASGLPVVMTTTPRTPATSRAWATAFASCRRRRPRSRARSRRSWATARCAPTPPRPCSSMPAPPSRGSRPRSPRASLREPSGRPATAGRVAPARSRRREGRGRSGHHGKRTRRDAVVHPLVLAQIVAVGLDRERPPVARRHHGRAHRLEADDLAVAVERAARPEKMRGISVGISSSVARRRTVRPATRSRAPLPGRS